MDIVLIDHYDSFSLNVLDWLERAGFSVSICRHDTKEMESLLQTASQKVIRTEKYRAGIAIESGSIGQSLEKVDASGHQIVKNKLILQQHIQRKAPQAWSSKEKMLSAGSQYLPPSAPALSSPERFLPLVFGPGPKSPKDYPHSMKLLSMVLGHWPILGICLGHQMLGALAGLDVKRSKDPHHGSQRDIFFDNHCPLFRGLHSPFVAATYNSLIVSGDLSDPWHICARNQWGEIEAIENHSGALAFGLQFHPESFLSSTGSEIARNWYDCITSQLTPSRSNI